MIDTHTHLYFEQFSEDITDVVNRALDVGVTRCYLPSISSNHNHSMLELEKKFPNKITSIKNISEATNQKKLFKLLKSKKYRVCKIRNVFFIMQKKWRKNWESF